jgi:proteasome assembly chaperone (PAC2) family protein
MSSKVLLASSSYSLVASVSAAAWSVMRHQQSHGAVPCMGLILELATMFTLCPMCPPGRTVGISARGRNAVKSGSGSQNGPPRVGR